MFAHASEPGILDIRGLAIEHAARLEEILEYRKLLGIVGLLRLLLGIEMLEVAVKLIEAMHGR
jgi:hypothetical protein